MKPTYSVRLPKTVEPRFPPTCVGCGGEPTTEVGLWSEAVGWWSLARFGSIVSTVLGLSASEVAALHAGRCVPQ